MRLKPVLTALFLITTLGLTIAAAKKMVASIDQAQCTQCGICAETCPENAIKTIKKGGKELYLIDASLCTGCGACVTACPVEAISLTGYTAPAGGESLEQDAAPAGKKAKSGR